MSYYFNNEILINSLKFNTVSLKFDVIPKNGLEEALRKISSIENEIKSFIEPEPIRRRLLVFSSVELKLLILISLD